MRIVIALGRLAVARPVWTIVGMLTASVVLATFVPRAVTDDAIAVDNEPARALQVIDEQFGEARTVVQILVSSDGAAIIGADGLRAAEAIEAAVTTSPAADRLIDAEGQPPIATYLADVQAVVRMAGLDPDVLDDATVTDLRAQARERIPPEFAALVDELTGPGEPATRALVLVFLDASGLDDDQALALQTELAAAVDDAALPEGFTAEAFSFGLMLGDNDIGPEVGRLFGTALAIILVVLAVVYWVPPGRRQRVRIVRRTVTDVLLTLVVIILSVVWMQGAGVLLGPGYAGLIGPFSPQTQIVPILVVGLGVDFAIHLLARYRSGLASAGGAIGGLDGALRSVGPTLVLCTAATAIGFLTNIASPVDFLATLGVLAALGITAAFFLTLTVLPAARALLDARADRRGRLPVEALAGGDARGLPLLIGRTAVLAERVPVTTVAVAMLVVIAGGYGFTQLDTEFELTDFVPRDAPALATFAEIADNFGGGFDETTQVLLRGRVAEARADGSLDAAVGRLADVPNVERLGAAPDASVALDDDGGLGLIELRTSAGQSAATELAEGITVALEPLTSGGIEVTVASPQLVQARIGEDIEDAQLTSLLIALGAAMVLLAIHYRVVARRAVIGVLTVLPVVLVLAATFGTMALTGIPLNAVTATLAALSIGIGVPFTIHVTARFLEERAGDGSLRSATVTSSEGALRRTVTATGGALAGSALTTAIGFGVLVTSTLRPFEQLGYVIVYAIAYSFVAAVLVLPSLLALWDRSTRRRGRDGARRGVGRGGAVTNVWTARQGPVPVSRHPAGAR